MSNAEQELKELKEKISKFENINLSFIAEGGMVKNIAWGKDYQKWDVSKKLDFAEALASAMNEAAEVMQNERNLAMEEALRLQKQLEKSQENLDIVRNTNITAITNFNKEKQQMAAVIRDLETKLSDAEKRAAVAEMTK